MRREPERPPRLVDRSAYSFSIVQHDTILGPKTSFYTSQYPPQLHAKLTGPASSHVRAFVATRDVHSDISPRILPITHHNGKQPSSDHNDLHALMPLPLIVTHTLSSPLLPLNSSTSTAARRESGNLVHVVSPPVGGNGWQ